MIRWRAGMLRFGVAVAITGAIAAAVTMNRSPMFFFQRGGTPGALFTVSGDTLAFLVLDLKRDAYSNTQKAIRCKWVLEAGNPGSHWSDSDLPFLLREILGEARSGQLTAPEMRAAAQRLMPHYQARRDSLYRAATDLQERRLWRDRHDMVRDWPVRIAREYRERERESRGIFASANGLDTALAFRPWAFGIFPALLGCIAYIASVLGAWISYYLARLCVLLSIWFYCACGTVARLFMRAFRWLVGGFKPKG